MTTEITTEIKNKYRFYPSYVEAMIYMYKQGRGAEIPISDLRLLHPTPYGNHRKLGTAPWPLFTDGTLAGTRKLTAEGVAFLEGKLQLPKYIATTTQGEYIPYGTESITIADFEVEVYYE